ncbi:MAG: type III-A CRISPR-associated RAMP protein Csm5 [Ignavibacteriales bacterium UTCHB2]|jgi:CRISPR-associated protein Csm5|nr:MAG: RAMP superfamily protein [Ignavibacteria bacterium ADurb.Bin266]OQY72708.1 MAG: type III-A CRISPR-associated RAMP protein Csm5 [Ignavibacteriales bacterium UTCHB2]HQI41153.1 type III-A CRISPR-associated RAMP protein Csm5 [Ignavibacteriaceae bacterium]
MKSEKYLSEIIKFKTLTPIFIAQNQANDLSPYSDFVQEENQIIYLDEQKFEKALFSKQGLLDEYVKSIRNKIDKSKTQSTFDLKSFLEKNFDTVNDFIKFKVPVDQDLKHQKIKRFINTSGRPYIPGSTIKGALRTAIIYNWLMNSDSGKKVINSLISKVQEIFNKIEKLDQEKKNSQITKDKIKSIDKGLKNLRSRKNIDKELNNIYDEQKLFGKIDKENKSGLDSRFIQVTDSEPFKMENISVLKLQRIKLRDNFEVSPLPSETLNPNIINTFTLKLEKSFIQPELTVFNSLDIKNIFKVLNEFSLASIIYELESFNSFHNIEIKNDKGNKTDYSNIIEFYNELKTIIEQNRNEFCVLRLGSGKTYFDNSIGLVLYKSNKEAFKQYRSLLELGKNPQTKKLVEGRFPTTRTIVEATKLPIGWIALSNDGDLLNFELYKTKIKKNESISFQPKTSTSTPIPNKDFIIAEIINDKSKPPRVKIIEGDYTGKETILSGVRLEGFGLKNGSKVYVQLLVEKKNLIKADYKGKVE